MRRTVISGSIVILFVFLFVACGGAGSNEDNVNLDIASCGPYTIKASNQTIYINGILEVCGGYSTETMGSTGFTDNTTCNGESAKVVISNIQYMYGEVASFNATINGTDCSYSREVPKPEGSNNGGGGSNSSSSSNDDAEADSNQDLGSGYYEEDSPDYEFSVSGWTITIHDLGACKDYVVDTYGAYAFDEEVTCGGETHTLEFEEIYYGDDGKIEMFDVFIDGDYYYYPTLSASA